MFGLICKVKEALLHYRPIYTLHTILHTNSAVILNIVRKALGMRRDGVSYRTIAGQLGVGVKRIRNAVDGVEVRAQRGTAGAQQLTNCWQTGLIQIAMPRGGSQYL